MEKLTLLLVAGTIGAFLLLSTLFLAIYIILCEYYELKFHYLTPKKSAMVNKSSGHSSATIIPSAMAGYGSSSGGGGGGAAKRPSVEIDGPKK